MNGWYRRRKTAAMLLAGLILLAATLASRADIGGGEPSGRPRFSVITQHHGVNGEEIERTITIPMEDAAYSLAGIERLESTSEYSRSRLDIGLAPGADAGAFYLELRDRVDRVYARLPQSVQKPQIVSSSSTQRAVFIVSFFSDAMTQGELSTLVDRRIKPSFEKVPGAGEVEVGGSQLLEVHIEVDEAKASSMGLRSDSIASFIQGQTGFMPLGSVSDGSSRRPLSLDGRLFGASQLGDLYLSVPPSATVALGDMARCDYGYREADTVSRVQGDRRIILYIKASGDANVIRLCKALRDEATRSASDGVISDIVYDKGKELEKALAEVYIALAVGMAVVFVYLLLASGSVRRALLAAATIPLSGLTTIGILSWSGTSIDHFLLAGMAVGIGMVIDSAMVIMDRIDLRGLDGVASIVPSLAAATATSCIVILPLCVAETDIPGMRSIALAILALLASSFTLSIVFIPPFAHALAPPRSRLTVLRSALSSIASFCSSRPGATIASATALSAALGIALVALPREFTTLLAEPTIFVHLEFESGASVASVDARTEGFVRRVRGIPGVERVESIARRGNAQLTVRHAEGRTIRKAVITGIEAAGASLSNGFAYLPELQADEGTQITVSVTGPDVGKLKGIAETLLHRLSEERWVTGGVLHFKDDPPAWLFKVAPDKAALAGLDAGSIAEALRWHLQGPVAMKWQEGGEEMDLRVMGTDRLSASVRSLAALPFLSTSSSRVRLDQLGSFESSVEPSRIHRLGRQRSASISVTTNLKDVDRIKRELSQSLSRVKLPEGYAFSVDESIDRLDDTFIALSGLFILAAFLVFACLAFVMESLRLPLMVVSVIPVCLAVPTLALAVASQGLTTSVVIGFIILSGMVVNNAILVIEGYREQAPSLSPRDAILASVSSRAKPLLDTSLTTMLGTLPMLITGKGEFGFMATLAFIMFFGILGSVAAAVAVVPALLAAFPGVARRDRGAN